MSLLNQREMSHLEVTTFTHSTGHRVGMSRPLLYDCILEDVGRVVNCNLKGLK